MRCPIASGPLALNHEMAEDMKLQSLTQMMTASTKRAEHMDQPSARGADTRATPMGGPPMSRAAVIENLTGPRQLVRSSIPVSEILPGRRWGPSSVLAFRSG